MGYVAVKGGQTAIENAEQLTEFFRVKDRTRPIEIEQIRTQMRLLVDKVMGEGSLYSPEHAALALKQVEGDTYEAAFMMRAYRATLERRYYSDILDLREMRIQRRISSAFREIPGGQILGPTRDYTQRLLNTRLVGETLDSVDNLHQGRGSDAVRGPDQDRPPALAGPPRVRHHPRALEVPGAALSRPTGAGARRNRQHVLPGL
jgi:alpha-D-ribose 1-methylphosphonate 5-triphosphate synthase subunit PhnI